jgi:hypothetical protein
VNVALDVANTVVLDGEVVMPAVVQMSVSKAGADVAEELLQATLMMARNWLL